MVLVRSISQIAAIHHAQDIPSALALAPEIRPTLVLLDPGRDVNELERAVDQLKVTWPQCFVVVLLDREQDRQASRAAGADLILLNGMRAATILEAIETLLSKGL
jgi:DNA-binding NarL/FixJ family response regulator